MAKRKFIQFEVEEDLHKRIRKDCAELNISISELMRELIKKYFNEDIDSDEGSDSGKPKE